MNRHATADSNDLILIDCDHELTQRSRAELLRRQLPFSVSAGPAEALERLRTQPAPLVLLAARSDHAAAMPALQQWPAMPVLWLQGADDVPVPEPVSLRGLLQQRRSGDLAAALDECQQSPRLPVAHAASSRRLLNLAQRVAETDATVLVSGESGVGKEVLARFIHNHSRRSQGGLLAINCAAIPESMLEAELFGFERGAFTGAVQARKGKLEAAAGGTLLLDEVSEMAPALQAKLLRVLQENEIFRLGSNLGQALDLRVVATSNRNLIQEVAAGRFREDLYYRLSVLPLHIEPLRERADDLLPLALRLLSDQTRNRRRRRLSDHAMSVICDHHWPGNVRELGNALARALIYSSDRVLSGSTMAAAIAPLPALARVDDRGLKRTRETAESQQILLALEQGQGSRRDAAEHLGISQRSLRYKIARMKEQGIAIPG